MVGFEGLLYLWRAQVTIWLPDLPPKLLHRLLNYIEVGKWWNFNILANFYLYVCCYDCSFLGCPMIYFIMAYGHLKPYLTFLLYMYSSYMLSGDRSSVFSAWKLMECENQIVKWRIATKRERWELKGENTNFFTS